MNCFQHIPESRGAIAQPPRGGATKKKADPTTQHALIGFKHPHLPQPSALHNRTCPCPLTSDRTRNARAPTSPRSIGFCAIWDCISSSSSWRWPIFNLVKSRRLSQYSPTLQRMRLPPKMTRAAPTARQRTKPVHDANISRTTWRPTSPATMAPESGAAAGGWSLETRQRFR